VAGGEGVGEFREAGSGRESRGAEDGGRSGRRRSGRMTAAEEEEDTTTTMAADRGQKKWLGAGGGGSLLLYIDKPLVLGRVTNRDKRGAFCHGW
jgi:hypothetical protein